MRYALFLAAALLAAAADPKPLAIQRVALSQFEDGAPVPHGFRFLSGETIFLSFHVSGYKPVGDEEPRVSLAYSIEVKDAGGIALIEPAAGDVDATLDTEDKNWMPKIRLTIAIPPHAPTGEYKIIMSVRDRVAQTQTRGESSFQVRGETFEASDKLVIRDLRFYRGEEDKAPLGTAAYRPGDTLWARFYMTGYQLGPKNAYEVSYGLAVLRPNGEAMFRQEEAAVEKQESFYPRRVLPAGMSLNLTKDLRPGQYTLVLMARDKVGNQSAEVRATFVVE